MLNEDFSEEATSAASSAIFSLILVSSALKSPSNLDEERPVLSPVSSCDNFTPNDAAKSFEIAADKEENTGNDDCSLKEDSSKSKSHLWTMLGFFVLAFSFLGGCFIGSTSNMLETKSSWVKTQWTYAMRLIYCLPLVALEALFTKGYLAKLKEMKQSKIIFGLCITPLLQIIWTFGLIYGADNLI